MKRLPNENKYQLDIKDQFKNEFEVGQLQGNNFHMTDSADLPMYIEPQGNIEQEVIEAVEGTTVIDTNMNLTDVDTTFENSLLPMGNISQETTEGYNKANTDNAIGKIVTNVANNSYANAMQFTEFNLVAGTTYQYLMYLDNVKIGGAEPFLFTFKDSSNATIKSTGPNTDFSLTQEEIDKISFAYIFYNNTGDYSSKVITSLVVVEKANADKPCEPYTGGQASPNLNYSSPVKGVGGHYDNEVRNKNLIELDKGYSKLAYNGIDLTIQEDGGIKVKGTAATNINIVFPLLSNIKIKNNTFIFSGTAENIENNKMSIRLLKNSHVSNENSFGNTYVTLKPNTISSLKATITDEKIYSHMLVFINSGYTVDTVIYPQLEVGDTATSYIEHQSQSLPIDIPTGQEWYSGKPYKLNGKWYRPIEYGKYVFTGNEAFSKHSSTSNNAFYINPSNNPIKDAKLPANNNINCECYSNNFSSNSVNNLVFKDLIGIGISSVNDIYCATSLNGISTVEDFKAHLAEQYANGTPLYMVYELATPTIEEITDTTLIEQLEAHDNAEFYEGVTNINSYKSSEDVADMPLEVHYNFITPSPSVERPSEVLEVGSDEEINLARLEAERKYRAYATGNFVNNENYNSYIAEVKPNKTYSFRRIGTDGVSNVAYFDKDMNYLSGQPDSVNIITPDNCRFFTVAVHKNNKDFMIYEGTIERRFTPHGYCRYDTVVENKNLFDKKSIGWSGNGVVEFYHIFLGAGTYTMSSPDMPVFSQGKNLFFLAGKVTSGANSNENGVDKDTPRTVTTTDGYVTIGNRYNYNNDVGLYHPEDYNWQIEKGTVATEYVEHQEQLFPIDLPIGKVLYNEKPVVELTDEEIEELGLEKAELYFKDKFEKYVFTGKEIYVKSSGYSSDTHFCGYLDKSLIQFKDSNVTTPNRGGSNMFKGGLYSKTDLDECMSWGSQMHIKILASRLSENSSAGLKAFLKELYDAGTPLYAVCELVTPIYTPIKDENFIKQYRDLQRAFSYYPVTNVNSYKPTTNVADLKLYVEYFKSNKITNK